MNGKERITRILKHEPVDRFGLFEHFWNDTENYWRSKGYLKDGECIEDHFDYDMQNFYPNNMVANLDFKDEIIEETDETILIKDGNGAFLRRHKLHDSTPEHVDFTVKTRKDWEKYIKPYLLKVDDRRIDFKGYRKARNQAINSGRFFCWSGTNVFELMHPVCGHEYMLMGMALDPEWIKDMVKTYSDLIIKLQQRLFEVEGYPDGIWFYEDMGFKEKPFMSNAMYKDILQPGHIKTIAYAHSLDLPVIMHSCGYIEPLLPDMIETGIDALQVIEIKAGMDLLKLYEKFGDEIAFIGGIDVRTLYSNDKDIINKELRSKIPTLLKKNAYVVHSDHSIPVTVDYESYKYFIKQALELGKY